MDLKHNYIPHLSWATTTIECAIGTAVLFPICEPKYRKATDPYREILLRLQEEGLNRNVFMLGPNREFIWRIAEYASGPDCVAKLDSIDDRFLQGISFRGRILRIAIADGRAEVVDWTK